MAFESLDDAMFWHGSLIGYMAGVKSACKDEDKSSLLLRMADTQARLEFMESENAKLRKLCSKFAQVVANDDVTFRKLREIAKRELGYDFIGAYDSSLGDMDQLPLFSDRMRELGIKVDE